MDLCGKVPLNLCGKVPLNLWASVDEVVRPPGFAKRNTTIIISTIFTIIFVSIYILTIVFLFPNHSPIVF